jgi:hypothetical protein
MFFFLPSVLHAGCCSRQRTDCWPAAKGEPISNILVTFVLDGVCLYA